MERCGKTKAPGYNRGHLAKGRRETSTLGDRRGEKGLIKNEGRREREGPKEMEMGQDGRSAASF